MYICNVYIYKCIYPKQLKLLNNIGHCFCSNEITIRFRFLNHECRYILKAIQTIQKTGCCNHGKIQNC